MRTYSPRRQSARWLDGDCPRGVLAIYDNGGTSKRNGSLDRYTVFYADTETDGRDTWVSVLLSSDDPGSFGGHDQMRAHDVAAYRNRFSHTACRWTDLPAAVRAAVKRDLR